MKRRGIVLLAACMLFLVLGLGGTALAYAPPGSGVPPEPTAWSIDKLGGKACAYRLHIEWSLEAGEPIYYTIRHYLSSTPDDFVDYGPYRISVKARALGELTTRAIRAGIGERFDIKLETYSFAKTWASDPLGPNLLWTY